MTGDRTEFSSRFKAVFFEVYCTVARKKKLYCTAKLSECLRERAGHIGQATGFTERYTFAYGKTNLQ
jgi:hypothetical protein